MQRLKIKNSKENRRIEKRHPFSASTPVQTNLQKTHTQFIENYDLPAQYNTTRLALIVKDPSWIYAYWEIAQVSIDSLSGSIGGDLAGYKCILRMFDITYIEFNGHNANSHFDIEVGRHVTSWYINLWNDNVSYCAQIGFLGSSGQFFPLATSNFVHTPRANISQRHDEMWMEVKENTHAPAIVSRLEASKALGKKYSGSSNGKGKKSYLTEDDIRAYYSNISPLLRKTLAKRRNRIYKFPQTLDKQKITLEGFGFFDFSKGKFIRKILLGSSEELVFLGASEFVQPGASENSIKKEKDFFFQIGTELIVYGRTEPDAEVWLKDKRIPLRSDGTFSLRFALPDTQIPLEFKAFSNDKQHKRKIETKVTRSTTSYSKD